MVAKGVEKRTHVLLPYKKDSPIDLPSGVVRCEYPIAFSCFHEVTVRSALEVVGGRSVIIHGPLQHELCLT